MKCRTLTPAKSVGLVYATAAVAGALVLWRANVLPGTRTVVLLGVLALLGAVACALAVRGPRRGQRQQTTDAF